jgi:hypothetical protein
VLWMSRVPHISISSDSSARRFRRVVCRRFQVVMSCGCRRLLSQVTLDPSGRVQLYHADYMSDSIHVFTIIKNLNRRNMKYSLRTYEQCQTHKKTGHVDHTYLTSPFPSTSSPIICTGHCPSSLAPSASEKLSTGDSEARHNRLVSSSESNRSDSSFPEDLYDVNLH